MGSVGLLSSSIPKACDVPPHVSDTKVSRLSRPRATSGPSELSARKSSPVGRQSYGTKSPCMNCSVSRGTVYADGSDQLAQETPGLVEASGRRHDGKSLASNRLPGAGALLEKSQLLHFVKKRLVVDLQHL